MPLETHISAIYRGPDTVYKLKKAVRLGFLDFTTLAARERFLRRELELNAPHVPGLYRDVVPITAGPALDGTGEPIDWVLRMAPVPADAFLDHMAGQGPFDAGLLRALADAIAAMHAAQPPCGASDPAGRLRQVAEGNAAAARDAGIDPALIEAWGRALACAIDAAAPAIEARAPLIRRAHGDLHLGNVLMWRGRPAPFDALEFDEALATIDPGYDLAFLLMDLELRQGRAAANQVLNRYVARTGDAGLVGPLPAFLSMRAMVRAHVEARRGLAHAALLEAALSALRPARAVVLAIGGLMGTGKSTLARALAPGLGPAPGALVLRSDEIRKRLLGVAPEQKLPPEGYSDAAHVATADALIGAMRDAAGHAVILDATFLDAGLRARAAAGAPGPFLGVWLHAPLAELERRVAARRGDASDAGLDVLRAAVGAPAPPGWLHVDATDMEATQQHVRSRLDLL